MKFKPSGQLRHIQEAVHEWYETLFRGTPEEHTKKTLAMRFLEEALELAQACDLEKEDVYRQLRYTFSRPKGTVEEEIAGVMMTLQHIGNMENIDIQDATLAELERISTPEMRKKIYDKQSYKNINGLVA
jgi:NTP pyrophosphatase (non-canonical NTP hydrolase)